MLCTVAVTRQKLAYWFFWGVFLASIPIACALSRRWWRFASSEVGGDPMGGRK